MLGHAPDAPPPPDPLARWGSDDLRSLLLRRARAGDDGSVVGFYDPGERTHRVEPQATFLGRAAAGAAGLLEAGVTPAQRLVVACPNPEAALLGFASAVLAGALPAIVAARPFDDPSAAVGAVHAGRHVLGPGAGVLLEVVDGEPGVPLPASDTGVVPLDPTALSGVDAVAALGALGPALGPDDPVGLSHFQLTSGSTSAKRAVAVTSANVLANCASMAKGLGLHERSVIVSWLPLYHDMGLVGQALNALVHGLDLFLMGPVDFVLDPTSWLRTISDRRGTFTASPTFGYDRCRTRVPEADLAALDLSSMETFCCGAEPVNAAVAAGFVERFAACGLRRTAFKPCYGLAEATLAVSLAEKQEPWRALRVERSSLARLGEVAVLDGDGAGTAEGVDVVALGPVLDGVGVRLRRDDGRLVEDELVCGEIEVTGPSVCAGYVGEGGDVVPFGEDGAARTGDVGFVEGGELFVVERVKNIVIRNGQNYSVHVLEQTLARHSGARLDDVIVLDADLERGGRLTGIVSVRPEGDVAPAVAAVEAGIEEYELPLDEVVFVARASMPRTTSGKKQHAAVREALRAGALEVVGRHALRGRRAPVEQPSGVATTDALEPAVLALVAEHARARDFDGPVLGASRFTYDLDFDSLALLELVLAAETRFAVEIPETALSGLRTVDDLVAVVAAGGVAPGAGVGAVLAGMQRSIPQTYRAVEEQRGRDVLVDGRWVADLASCNYLGLDLHPEVIASVAPMVERWGVHPSWTRAVASPQPYLDLERALADLVGVPEAVVFPTITLAHLGVLPALAGPRGAIVLDAAAHQSLREAAGAARAAGAVVSTARHGDLDDLDARLARVADREARVVAVDGVYSMSGEALDVAGLVEVAERHDAVVYVDDAHGFGVLGESPGPGAPYGHGGNGVVRHRGVGYDHIVYVGGMSKAFSSLAAFVSAGGAVSRERLEAVSTMVFSGPVPVASLASALAGLRVNEHEGDALRSRLWSLTRMLLDGVHELGLEVDNPSAFPIVNVVLGRADVVLPACDVLWEEGVLLTPALFPAVPLDRGGVRFTLTASNTEEHVARALAGLERVRDTLLPRAPIAVEG